jgi:signal transduction histidine kinase
VVSLNPRARLQAVPRAYRRLPIRWRMAGGSAVLTLIILCGFAAIVGVLTTRQIRSDFQNHVAATADGLASQTKVVAGNRPDCQGPDLNVFGASESAAIRILTLDGNVICRTRDAPDFGLPQKRTVDTKGYRVETRLIPVVLPTNPSQAVQRAILQYGQPYSDTDRTLAKVRLFLILGVLGGAGLALVAGLYLARRAMRPIAQLTQTAREIERTRDPTRSPIPVPEADDEVAELAHTLENMLAALDAARAETEATLERQRAFVADASHELRTPLTSVLANLELLHDQLSGAEAETAAAALRSSQRMRRLVADLLLLARADAGRMRASEPTDLGEVLVDAAAELTPIANGHDLALDPHPAVIDGVRDDLHRMAGNLISNALRHTPEGTVVRAAVYERNGAVELRVEDNGPGIPDEIVPRIFERFIGGGDRAGSTGLGLAIVRAVAEAHGGGVTLEQPPDGGARFVVTLPRADPPTGPAPPDDD